MEKNFDDMSSEERVIYLVDLLHAYLLSASLEARKALRPSGCTPETAKQFKLLALIEGSHFGQHETCGLMDLVDHLRDTLIDEGMYHSEDEDEEEFDEDESDELTEVEA